MTFALALLARSIRRFSIEYFLTLALSDEAIQQACDADVVTFGDSVMVDINKRRNTDL